MSNGYRPRCTRQHPGRDETIISIARLQELERKERGHDDYLEAIRRWARVDPLGDMHTDGQRGYRQAIMDLSRMIVDAGARRMQA